VCVRTAVPPLAPLLVSAGVNATRQPDSRGCSLWFKNSFKGRQSVLCVPIVAE